MKTLPILLAGAGFALAPALAARAADTATATTTQRDLIVRMQTLAPEVIASYCHAGAPETDAAFTAARAHVAAIAEQAFATFLAEHPQVAAEMTAPLAPDAPAARELRQARAKAEGLMREDLKRYEPHAFCPQSAANLQRMTADMVLASMRDALRDFDRRAAAKATAAPTAP